MAYTVDIIYSTNEDYSNPQTVTEAGQPSSIELTNLVSDQAYYVKAVLKNDGATVDEDTDKFTTLSAKTEYFRITNTSDSTGTFYITRVESPTTADLKYSLDGVNWTTANLSGKFALRVASGANVYMKGTNTSGFSTNLINYYKMSMNVNHRIGGNVMSIVDEENYATITSVPNNCFRGLFLGDTYLINAGDVNFGSVTSIDKYGCGGMFGNCVNLRTPADLSNITSIGSDGCSGMYFSCSLLTTVSDLSNITSIGENGCNSMYSGCTTLKTPADLSNVTSIGDYGCANMYKGCKRLTTCSDLSNVTSIGEYMCISMYSDCTSLTTPADFSKVTSIGENGCRSMYSGCTSLKTPADLSNVTSIGENGCSNMYSGCKRLTTGSDLSNVTSIGVYGCYYMYSECTSLTTPADFSKVTSIGQNACQYMYSGCTSLTTVTAPNISEWDTSNFKYWLDDVASAGIVYKPAGLEIPTDSTSGVPTGWTTQDY